MTGLGTASGARLAQRQRQRHAQHRLHRDGRRRQHGRRAGSVNTGTVKIDIVAPTSSDHDAGSRRDLHPEGGGRTPATRARIRRRVLAWRAASATVATGAAIDTATVGPKTFTVTAKDVAGNQTATVRNYLVVYAFTLTPLKTPANLGSAVPIDWKLKDALGVSINSLSTLAEDGERLQRRRFRPAAAWLRPSGTKVDAV